MRTGTQRWELGEARGEVYRSLLLHAAGPASVVVMVTPEEAESSSPWMKAIVQLSRFAIAPPSLSKHWPGTPGGRRSRVHRYRLDRPLAARLASMAEGLFDWKLPDLPEDLSILRDEREWLVSVTHEELCWFHGTRQQLEDARVAAPGLQVRTGPGYRGGR